MTRRSALGGAAAIVAAVSMHIIVSAQSSVGPNVNVVTGVADQFIGDMLRQRQNESVLGISSINPDHMVVAYNDYRTVDFAADQGVGTPAGQRTLFARLLDVLTWPWKRERERETGEEAEAAQAWIGLSFSDNGGATWYTGLLPGHPFGISPEDVGSPLRAYEAASDPVMAFTPNQFFTGGIAFTPGGGSAGFVARLTDLNKSERGQNIHYDFTRIVTSVPDATRFVDKPSIAAGPNGHVYVAFVVFDNTDP